MRDGFARLAKEYPSAAVSYQTGFAGSPLGSLVGDEIPKAIRFALPEVADGYRVQGSIGKGTWTHTPWVALLDPAVTTTTEDGLYVIYLLSFGGERLYLTVNQGCTTLKNTVGVQAAKRALPYRAHKIWERVRRISTRLGPISMNLNVARTVWRGRLYELGLVAGREYDTRNLPQQSEMEADLREALRICRMASLEGDWEDEDTIVGNAAGDGFVLSFQESKRYRQHKAIERQQSHSARVKKPQGTRCKGCDLDMSDVYGALGAGMLDAHHLVPLSVLPQDRTVSLDPLRDFAVLCPNCHRAIHRLPDCSDIEALRSVVRSGSSRLKA